MKVSEIMKERTAFSFEVFPPKADQPIEPLFGVIDRLTEQFRPDFISCTYGAGGTNKGRSAEICDYIVKQGNTIPLSHFTCIGNTRQDVSDIVGEYIGFGVSNFLLMRGDYPPGQTGTGGDFTHADTLIKYVREQCPDIGIAAACYPEKHITAPSMDYDIAFMRSKQDNGADLFMTQLCFDVDNYRRFVDMVRAANIALPMSVGIMPVLAKDATIRMAVSNGCSIPAGLAEIMGKYGDNAEDFRKAGKEWTVGLMYKYLAAGAEGLHIYTLNKHDDVADIVQWSGLRKR